MSKYWAFSGCGTLHYVMVKTMELTPKQILPVPCTTCGAAIGEVCELNSGAPRTEPHRDRKLSAAKVAETKPSKQRVQRQTTFYLLWSPVVSSCCSSAFCQLELGLYSFIALARASVFLPRSFSYTTPSWLTTNVITPDDLYSAG